MREKPVNVSAPHIFPLVVVLLLSLAPFSSSSLRSADAGPSTAISPTPAGAGSLRTIVTPSSATTNLCSGNCVITGGTRPGGGTNLFHSFSQFNVGSGDITTFQNGISFDLSGATLAAGLPTSNILGRVTGGNISNIFGTIQTSGFGNANLFLMNPAGFLFGPNATVNVGGMVAFTSADYLRLGEIASNNAGIFHADPAQLSVLTSAPVAAFGFLGSNPGAITVQGSQLSVSPGQSISLVGGNITVQSAVLDDGTTIQPARLSAQGGGINLASVASPGEFLYPSLQTAPNVNGQSFTSMGAITLSQGTTLDVSADAAGTVRIRGGQLVMDQATISADTVDTNGAPVAIDINLSGDLSISSVAIPALTARTTGAGDAGEIRISAENINVTATGFGDSTPFSVIDTHTSGSGKAGNVNVTATDNLTLTGDPFDFVFAIDSGTIGPEGGQGGNVTLNAKNVDIQYAQINTGDFVAVYTFEEAAGSGGNLTINADSLNLTNSFLVTDGSIGGRAGDLTISAREVQMSEFSALSATGFLRGGTLQVNADHFVVDSSQIEAFVGPEGGGGIIFNGKVGQFTNGSTVTSSTGSSGNAGNITFTATERLTFADSTDPDLAPIRPSGLFTTAIFGTGNAAEITVNTPVLELTGGARFDATTRTSGNGGRINILADQVMVSGERPLPIFEGPLFGLATSLASGIYSRTVQSRFCTGPCGNAGPISITTNSLSLDQGARIDSRTTSAGRGGDITLNANQISIAGTTIDGAGSGIFTDTQGSGAGGNIFINANSVTLQNGGTLSAATSGAEPSATGGTIIVNAGQVNLTNGGLITASTTGAGDGGSITIYTGTFASNASTMSSTAAQAQGGDITITAGQSVTLTNGSTISASSNGPGNAGDILINAGQNYTSTNSSVTTQATAPGTEASGGNITVLATDMVQLTNSQLNASVQGSSTTVGGNITIDPQYVILQNSQILAQATQGQGGAISITITNGGFFLPDATSTVSASSQFGVNGTVTIQSPNAPASGKIVPLSQKPLLATSLLNQRCAALAGGEFSSFIVAGRDSLPTEPGGWLASPLAALSADARPAVRGEGREGMTLGASLGGETPLLSLRQIAPAGFLTQAFAVDESAGCQS